MGHQVWWCTGERHVTQRLLDYLPQATKQSRLLSRAAVFEKEALNPGARGHTLVVSPA